MNLIKQHKKIVCVKFSDGVKSRTKVETWQSITQQINAAFPCVSRTVEQVQKRYHNITSSGKNRVATQRRLFCKTGGGPSGDKPLLDPLSGAVADILSPDSLSIIRISGLTSYDSVTHDSCEDNARTCIIMIPFPQSSQESLPSGSTLIHRPTSVDWEQPITKEVIALKIEELQNTIKFYSAQMEVARAQMEVPGHKWILPEQKWSCRKLKLNWRKCNFRNAMR